MKVFKKELFLYLLVSCAPLVASPFDTDISDWSQGKQGLCAKGENLQYVVEKYRRKLGVKAPVEVVLGDSCSYKGLLPSETSPDYGHTISLKEENFDSLKKRAHDNGYYEAVGVLCHELGHVKHLQDPVFEADKIRTKDESIFRIYRDCDTEQSRLSDEESFETCRQRIRYEDEMYADAQVPNEKQVLTAFREYFRKDHEKNVRPILGALGLKSEGIDFTLSMDEEHAQLCDALHKRYGDYHPSLYRRAYLVNERLKKLKAQERELCKKLAQHVQLLGVSELV